MTLVEIGANLAMAISILLAGRNSVHTWWTGIVGCALFLVVFFQARLYADVMLQLFFAGTSMLGWWQWLHGDHGVAREVARVPRRIMLWTVPAGFAAAAGYGALLHRFTNAYAPFADSTVLVFSVVAQLLLMRRCIESWPFWLLVNLIAVPLYASRGLYLTSVLYGAYLVNAAISWWHWQRLARRTIDAPDDAPNATAPT
ncbi:MAG: nicotinamide riboside transporter PnuC [Gemmatimonadaceae bacterium]